MGRGQGRGVRRGQDRTMDCLLQVTKLLKDSKRIDNNNCSNADSQNETDVQQSSHLANAHASDAWLTSFYY